MTTIGKNVYFNVLDNIVKNYNNTIHNSIKMKPKDVKNNNLTEYVLTKMFCLKVIYLIGQKKVLLLVK